VRFSANTGLRLPSNPVAARIAHALMRIPLAVRWLLLFAVVVGVFFVVIAPLFNSGGPPVAEIDGNLPASLQSGANRVLDLDIDNTGFSVINPICVGIKASSGVVVKSVTFQGLDTVAAGPGPVCGGQLTGQESISISVTLDLRSVTSVQMTLTPQQGSKPVGNSLQGVILVTK
jgi:hypothetical protein